MGDPATARAEAAAGLADWSRQGYHAPHAFALLALAQADLYEGDGRAAHARIEAEWPRLAKSMFLRNEMIRVTMTHLRARAATAAARAGHPDGARRLVEATRSAKRLAGERAAWSKPLAELAFAEVAHAAR